MDQTSQLSDERQENLQRLNRYISFLSQDRNNVSLLIDTIRLAIDLGEIKISETLISEHKEGLKNNSAFNALAGHVMLASGRVRESVDFLMSALNEGENDLSIFMNLAYAYFVLREYEQTLSILDKHIDLVELFPSIYYVLYARILHIIDKPEHAIDMLEKFHAENQITSESAGLLSLILFEQNQQTEKALNLANEALIKNPKTIEALIARTSLYLDTGHYEQALIDIQQATKFHPESGRAWSSLAQVEFNNLNFEAARNAATIAVIYMTDHIGTWHLLGWAHLMLGELDEALSAFEKSYDLDRRFAETHGGLAAVYAHMNQVKKANQHIKMADRLDSNGFASTYAKIVLFSKNNETEKANSLFDAAKNKFNPQINNTPQNLIQKRLYELSKRKLEDKTIH